MTRNYTELLQLDSLEDRFEYLAIGGQVGATTFGFDRWVNQQFYRSREWQLIRNHVIARDVGMDLGVDDHSIHGSIYIHHMNPLVLEDITEGTDNLIDPEFLISCAHNTHNAIHYGDRSLLPQPYVERRPGDTTPWRR